MLHLQTSDMAIYYMIPNSRDDSHNIVTIRLHGDLRQFLKSKQQSQAISVKLAGTQSLKHIVESLHVPHTEVGGACQNDTSLVTLI